MHQPESAQHNIFTVTKLNRLARRILELEIGQVWLSAEISNFVAASSGHWYFTLKDDKAQIRAAMFRNANRRVSAKPRNGDKVLIRANISLYEARGDYQLIVEHLQDDGEGVLKLAFEQLKVQLSAEGLFSQASKKPIPEQVKRVGIITSPTGAALHDILTVLRRRSPSTEIIVYPSMVQGKQASSSLVHALQMANTRNEVDVIILGRGGGSLEDLWCFNEEALARAIFASDIPIISAVGHETDVSISDFAADLRAATPSAAAELVSMDQREHLQYIESLRQRLSQVSRKFLEQSKLQHQTLAKQLQLLHPRRSLEQQAQHLDRLQLKLYGALNTKVAREDKYIQNLRARLHQKSPQLALQKMQNKREQLTTRLEQGMSKLISQKQYKLATQSQLLDTVSPLATLARGYSISFSENSLVKTTEQLEVGDKFETKLIDGTVLSRVEQVTKNRAK